MSTTNKSKAKLLKGKSLARPFITTFAVALPAAAAMAGFPACSTTNPDASQNGPNGVGPTADGPCANGTTRSCHIVTGTHKGFVDCYEGSQTCQGTAWGPCGGSGTISSHYMPSVTFTSQAPSTGGLHTLAGANPPPVSADSGTDGGNTCDNDPCNPYCWTFDATPDAGPLAPPTPIPNVPPGGTAVCPPSETAIGAACTTNRDCYQDSHCDTATSKCVWNIDTGYTDPACAGFDLEMNAWCPSTGGANPPPATYTLCNRGTQPLSPVAGATTRLGIWQTNGGPAGNSASCVAPYYAPPDAPDLWYSDTLAAALAPGACVSVDANGVNGNRHTFLYATRTLTTSTTTGAGVPITYTTTVNHGLKVGDVVTVTGVTGNTNANVTNQAITAVTANTFTIGAVMGNAAYIAGGAIRASLTECNAAGNGGCFNNEGSAKNNGSCGTCGPSSGSTSIISAPYHAICPTPDVHPEWTFLVYDVTAGSGDAKFELQTAPDNAGVPGVFTAFVTAADPPLAGEPWVRTPANPVGLAAPVPPAIIPVGGVLGGLPTTRNEWITVKITITGTAPPTPILNSWALTYSCVPSE